MTRRPLFRYLFPAWMLTVLLVLVGVYLLAASFLQQVLLEERSGELEAQARMLAMQAGPLLGQGGEGLQALVTETGRLTGTRFTILHPDGRVAADSAADPAAMESHFDRPEIIDAHRKGRGVAVRASPTLGVDLAYVAVRAPGGVVRAARPMEGLTGAMRTLRLQLLWGVLVAVLLAGGVGWFGSRRVALALGEMAAAAARVGEGEYSSRLPSHRVKEVDDLAAAMNRMAGALEERLAHVTRQKQELETVLGGMVEGVVAVDPGMRVHSLNPAAARILSLSPEEGLGKSVQETIRNPGLQALVTRALAGEGPLEMELVLRRGEEERFLKVGVAPLLGQRGVLGAVVVLDDLTRLRRLERVRRDFVANVSHEVRTPITSIKGAAESLLAGALSEPESAERFAGIIARHAARLDALVEDLLRLSRVEQEEERGEVKLQVGPLRETLAEAVEAARPLAEGKGVPVELDCPQGVRVRQDHPLLVQAVLNLVDNAVRYSDPGRPVKVTGRAVPGGVEIEVKDEGMGIPAEHLPRLFERFYRVDPARSRALGGTGLGLSIVKHIVSAHGGKVTVSSALGKGSVFTIRVPSPEENPLLMKP